VQEAAGYILYVAEATGPRFLLLRNAKHHTWGFPKGKLEKAEEPRAGARRELREETGIAAIHEDREFEAQSLYDLKADADASDDGEPEKKRVRYFLARAGDRKFARSREHDAADWMRPEDVLATLQSDDLKRVFREALARMKKTGSGQA
jgi:8-oxo-dGTP diphosphatase